MTNIIKEDKSVNADNFAFLLAQSNYNLSSVFRSRNHNETIADTPMIGTDLTYDSGTNLVDLEEKQSRNHQYQFRILGASTNQIADLKDAEINVVASVFSRNTEAEIAIGDVPRLGNQALLALFSSIELYIDSTLIERIDYPGLSANADYSLRYPHNKESEKVLESNGFITQLEDSFVLKIEDDGDDQTKRLTKVEKVVDGVYDFHNNSVMWTVIGSGQGNWLRGLITQRIRLSDIFPCINTLPPIFNHSVVVNFTRNSSNDIIASASNSKQITRLNAFIDFKIVLDCYIITDELKKAAMSYYSKPIETIFTKCKQIPVGFVSEPKKNVTTTFNVSVDSAYKNKLAVFCIPRTTNFNNQAHSATKKLTEENTTFTDAKGRQFDVAQAPSNSYTHGGLSSLTIYTMNGVKLFSFDMKRNGDFSGKFERYDKMAMLDIKPPADTAGNINGEIYNYQEVYQQYLKAREQFGQIPEEGLDYITFMKEYCIYCVDLSPFSINAGENLRVEMSFGDWGDNYNPYRARNDPAGDYMSKQLLTLFYSDKILRLLPNQNVELADLFAMKTEADETNEL